MDRVIKIGRWIKSIIAPSNQDVKIAILSIAIAAIIWVLSALNEDYTTQINCPVQFIYDQEGIITVKEPPSQIRVTVSGVGWDLLKQTIAFNRSPVQINIDNPVETDYMLGSDIDQILDQYLSSLTVENVVTDSIKFEIQEMIKKNVFLDVDSSSLNLEEHYYVISPIRVSPDSATVSGPVSLIDTLSDIIYIQIAVENIDEDINRLFEVNNPNSRLLTVQPEEVQIEIDVSLFVPYQKELDVDLVNFPMDSSVYIMPPNVILNFRVQQEYSDRIHDSDFIIIADFNNINLQDSTVNLEIIDIPSYVRNATLDSARVKVIYEKEKNT